MGMFKMVEVVNQKKQQIRRILIYSFLNALNLIIVYSSRSIAFAILGYNRFIFNHINKMGDEYGSMYSIAYQESRDIVIAIVLMYIVITYIFFIIIIKKSYFQNKFKIINKWHLVLILLNCFFAIVATAFLFFFSIMPR